MVKDIGIISHYKVHRTVAAQKEEITNDDKYKFKKTNESTYSLLSMFGEGKRRINRDQISYVGKEGRKVTDYSVVSLHKIP